MEIRKATPQDITEIVGMAKILFNESNGNLLQQEFQQVLRNEKEALFVATINNIYAGFLHMSLRNDYVEGIVHYPVAYMEGLGLKKRLLRNGI